MSTSIKTLNLSDLKVGMKVSRSDASIVLVTRTLPGRGVYLRGTWEGAREVFTSFDGEQFDLVACPGDWTGVSSYIPGTNPEAVCARCGTHWSRHTRDDVTIWYTVTGPSGAWIKTHSGGPSGWSRHTAIEQARQRSERGALHTVEVRIYNHAERDRGTPPCLEVLHPA